MQEKTLTVSYWVAGKTYGKGAMPHTIDVTLQSNLSDALYYYAQLYCNAILVANEMIHRNHNSNDTYIFVAVELKG